MRDNTKDREFDKFRPARDGKSKVANVLEGDTGLLEGISYDDIQASYPNNTTELYTFFFQSVQVAAIQVTYTNASKHTFLRARRV